MLGSRLVDSSCGARAFDGFTRMMVQQNEFRDGK